MRVLVTGMFTQAAVFAVRRFAELGFRITGASAHPMAYGLYSRYVDRRLHLPLPRREPVRYAWRVLEELERTSYDFYFPTFEETFLLARYRDAVAERTRTVLPPFEDIRRVHDKSTLHAVTAAAGVRAPETLVPGSTAEAERLIAQVRDPVVIKLRQTCNAGGLVFVEDPRRLAGEYFALVARMGIPEDGLPVIQRFVRGRLVCSLELAQQGRVVGQVQCVGLRTLPRRGGTTTARQTVDEPACAEAARRVIAHLGWTGFIGFDYLVEEGTGAVFVIDCNPRCSVNLNLAGYAGSAWIPPWMDIARGRPAAEAARPRVGVRSKTHFADTLWYLGSFLDHSTDGPTRAAQRHAWWHDRGFHYDIMSGRDWGPTAMLYPYLLLQTPKLLDRRYDPGQLFLFYDQLPEL